MNLRLNSRVLAFVPVILLACYSAPQIDGFDSQRWKSALTDCTDYRLQHVQLLLDEEGTLKGEGQNQVQQLLGKPTRHELYNRNQKFFYYDLNCEGDTAMYQLRIRFDALGKLREMSQELKP